MKKLFLLLVALFIILFPLYTSQEKPMNGVMIDCARLLEKHEYYYRLIDFMEEWNMNTLLLHFSDDHGISIALPGFEKLAHPRAFTPEDITKLVNYAQKRNIDIIPELEVFGHTRYITDHPDYHQLYVGNRSKKIVFNAVDPQKPETRQLMQTLLEKVAQLFPSPYLHLGCDEVNLDALKLNENQKDSLWAEYVNTMIAITKDLGKKPMIWSDHVRKNAEIAKKLDKEVILVEWNYSPDYSGNGPEDLLQKGFNRVIMAPSISCWRNRVIPSEPQLKNVTAHANKLGSENVQGLINTVWLPMRYVQGAMYYGIAYGAYLVNDNIDSSPQEFNKYFAKNAFDLQNNDKMNEFLETWTQLHLHRKYYSMIINNNYEALNNRESTLEIRHIRDLSKSIIEHNHFTTLPKNQNIYDDMFLSAKIMYVLSEGLLLHVEKSFEDRYTEWSNMADTVILEAEKSWDTNRFADDPAKYQAKFPNQENSHLLIVLRKLRGLY